MAEYIEREAAIRAAITTSPMMPSQWIPIKHAIESIPAADVRENVMRTNADRIRSMSDEELAEFLWSNEWGHFPRSEKGWLDWLRQEATE